jgi:hypothetical protein
VEISTIPEESWFFPSPPQGERGWRFSPILSDLPTARDQCSFGGGRALLETVCRISPLYLSSWVKTNFRSVYQPSIVGDGNFKLEHVIQKFPEEDIILSDGRGFFVGVQRYSTKNIFQQAWSTSRYLVCPFGRFAFSKDNFQKVKCHNHCAMSQANGHSGSQRDHLHATGVGACACTRHGCFYPHTVVDFQKGER